jgi:predicted transcriptional regulator
MAEVKRITIRVSPALHRRLHKVADAQEISLNKLAVRALETYVEKPTADQERLPLRELSTLLAPAAKVAELTEEELLQHARQVRHRIWRERYEKAIQAVAEQGSP